jgi:FkbH-like protein
MNNLRITGTSNLLAHNKGWDVLTKDVQVSFGEYGDWVRVFNNYEEYPVLWVVFLDDMISPDRLLDNPKCDWQDYLKVILQPLTSRLNAEKNPTLVAFSGWRPESIVSRARFPSSWEQIAMLFKKHIYGLAEKHPMLHLISLDDVFAEQGMLKCFDTRNYYTSRCRMSFQGLECLSGAVKKVLQRVENAAKKVLVLDCDNTLWGGVIGEVGLSGITLGSDGLGQAFSDFQRAAIILASQGVLLTIASMNNEDEVWEVFEKHPGMQIRKNDLVAWRINWQEKTKNLEELANELNLGIDSFVFWDDNPLEREKMRLTLPQVMTPEVPQDVTVWPSLLDSFDAFAKFSLTDEDSKKVQQYKQRSEFVTEQKQVCDQTVFLKSIFLHPTTLPLTEETFARAEQLCQKTNQFNLRTERYTLSNLRNIAKDSHYESFLVKLKDRFGNHGIVALVIVRMKGDSAFLDSFLMSCRILGRQLEAWILHEMGERLKANGCRWILAEFLPTPRNTVASSFLPDHGLTFFEWKKLTRKHPVYSLHNLVDESGLHYYADLENLLIPNLEVFQNENI